MSVRAQWFTIAALLGCCALATAASNGTSEEALPLSGSTLQSEMPPITTVRLHLRDGDFRVVATDSDDITIRSDGKNPDAASKVRVLLKRTGNSLDVTLKNVPKRECQITILVPRETNLYARMRAGDLSIDGVSGNKDLEMLAGDLTIQGADSADYGPVDLSVKFGDLHGEQFGSPKGTVGNSLRHDGSGKYRLHAHVFAGDLTLRP